MNRDERIVLPAAEPPRPLSRRAFLSRLSAATAGSGFLGAAFAGCSLTPSQKAEASEAVVDKVGKVPKVKLGARMGDMQVSRIVISQDWSPDLYKAGLDAGINFVHKAGYWNRLPEAFQNVPRESYYTDITVDSTPDRPDDEEAAYRQVTDSLRSNGLKYYDIFRAHYGWHTVHAMKTYRGTYRAFQRLKREGKVRYFGVSQHGTPGDGGYERYVDMIAAQVDDGLIDSYQVFFAYGKPKDVHAIFEKARTAGIGMCAMKTFAHGADRMQGDRQMQASLKAPGMTGRACVRYALTAPGADGKPIFHCCVSAIHNFDQFEENIGAVGAKVARADGFEPRGEFA